MSVQRQRVLASEDPAVNLELPTSTKMSQSPPSRSPRRSPGRSVSQSPPRCPPPSDSAARVNSCASSDSMASDPPGRSSSGGEACKSGSPCKAAHVVIKKGAALACRVAPSGRRRIGEGTEDMEQGIISADFTRDGAIVRITLLAAGFIIGSGGSSVRDICKASGAEIQSWSEHATGGSPRPSRVFKLQGARKSVGHALDIICAAVAKYKELSEGKFAGSYVPRLQKIQDIDFHYQPPPRSAVPHAAALQGTYQPRLHNTLPMSKIDRLMVDHKRGRKPPSRDSSPSSYNRSQPNNTNHVANNINPVNSTFPRGTQLRQAHSNDLGPAPRHPAVHTQHLLRTGSSGNQLSHAATLSSLDNMLDFMNLGAALERSAQLQNGAGVQQQYLPGYNAFAGLPSSAFATLPPLGASAASGVAGSAGHAGPHRMSDMGTMMASQAYSSAMCSAMVSSGPLMSSGPELLPLHTAFGAPEVQPLPSAFSTVAMSMPQQAFETNSSMMSSAFSATPADTSLGAHNFSVGAFPTLRDDPHVGLRQHGPATSAQCSSNLFAQANAFASQTPGKSGGRMDTLTSLQHYPSLQTFPSLQPIPDVQEQQEEESFVDQLRCSISARRSLSAPVAVPDFAAAMEAAISQMDKSGVKLRTRERDMRQRNVDMWGNMEGGLFGGLGRHVHPCDGDHVDRARAFELDRTEQWLEDNIQSLMQ